MADLTITASQVQVGTAADTRLYMGISGATITAGQTCYIDPDDSWKIKLADSDSADADVRRIKGVAVCGASSGQMVVLQTEGTMTLGAGAAPVKGRLYVLSDTAGGIMPAADLESGDYTQIVGVGGASNTMKLLLGVSELAAT